MRGARFASAFAEKGEVFRDGACVGLCCELGGANAVGDEALVAGDPRVEFSEWLEQMGFDVII